jgi:putative aldouronate transport system substrate-binding protein
LIDPEYATNTTQKVIDTKFANNQAGAYFGWLGAGFANYMSVMKPNNPNFDIIGVPNPTLKNGDTRDFGSFYANITANTGAAISSGSKYIKELIRWFDWNYTDEGVIGDFYGIEGITYNMVEGKPILTDYVVKNPDGLSYATALCKYTKGPTTSAGIYPFDYFKQVLALDQQKAALVTWSNAKAEKLMPSGLALTTQELEAISQKLTEIQTYTDEMIWTRMIMGKVPLEKMDEYIATIKKMGIEDCIKAYQDALDRYNKR